MTYRFEQGGKAHKHNNTYAALMDAESCLAREREAHTEIIQLDHDINYAGDSGYTGWAQFDDDEIYVVSYIKADTPHLQVKEAGGYDGEFADAPKVHIRGYAIGEGHFLNRPLEEFIAVADGVHDTGRGSTTPNDRRRTQPRRPVTCSLPDSPGLSPSNARGDREDRLNLRICSDAPVLGRWTAITVSERA